MPTLALVLCLVWFLTLFVLRSWLQWRRTGSSGVVPFREKPGSLGWWAGIAVIAGLLLAMGAPVAALRGGPGSALFFSNTAAHLVGALLGVLGIAGGLAAQLHMGDSWRVGVDEGARTQLVTGGLFRYVRNPIFTFVLLSAVGIVLVVPNALALAALGATVFGVEAQVRAVEEPYLLRTHGSAYADYAARVGRFLPGVGRLADG